MNVSNALCLSSCNIHNLKPCDIYGTLLIGVINNHVLSEAQNAKSQIIVTLS